MTLDFSTSLSRVRAAARLSSGHGGMWLFVDTETLPVGAEVPSPPFPQSEGVLSTHSFGKQTFQSPEEVLV